MGRKLNEEQYKQIIKLYELNETTVWSIAERFGVSARQVERIAKNAGVIRTITEANKASAHLKDYSSARVGRKRCLLPLQVRYDMLADHPYCSICGRTADDNVRLEIDHKDENFNNNDLDNLWVLCDLCNKGKYISKKKRGLRA